MSDIKKTENVGGLIISEEVIASIAQNAALDIEGVAELAPQPVNIGSIFRKGEASKSIKVRSTDSDIIIDVYIVLKYGMKIPVVSEAVQRNIKEAVQNMTGRVVTNVNVHVMDIALDKESDE